MNEEYEDFEKGSQSFPIGIFSQSTYIRDPHHHIEYEIFSLKKGKIIFGFEGKEEVIQAGDVVFIDSFVNHYAKRINSKDLFEYDEIVFDISSLGLPDDPCRIFFSSIRIQRFLKIPQEITNKITLAAGLESKSGGREIIIKSVLFEILSHVIKTNQYEVISLLGATKRRSISAIENALVYIRDNYKENISMDSILDLTNYSKSHFIRLFKESTGMNLSEYINKYRIEKACLDLIYSNKNITEIATTNGFNNIQYFSRTFKECMKCTPKQYQKKGQHITLPDLLQNK